MDQTPSTWGVHKMGYTHRVYVGDTPQTLVMYEWLHTQLGDISQGAWIDQYGYVCFQHESDAAIFEMVWYS